MESMPSAWRIFLHKLSPGCISGIPSNPRMRISLPDIPDYPFFDPQVLKQPAGPRLRVQLGEPENIRGVVQVECDPFVFDNCEGALRSPGLLSVQNHAVVSKPGWKEVRRAAE